MKKSKKCRWGKSNFTSGWVLAIKPPPIPQKKAISKNATVGVYYWKHGSDFVKYAEQMIEKNIRVNNEFYVCPVFNEAIYDKKRIIIDPVDEMHGLGTPEDLRNYIYLKDFSTSKNDPL